MNVTKLNVKEFKMTLENIAQHVMAMDIAFRSIGIGEEKTKAFKMREQLAKLYVSSMYEKLEDE